MGVPSSNFKAVCPCSANGVPEDNAKGWLPSWLRHRLVETGDAEKDYWSAWIHSLPKYEAGQPAVKLCRKTVLIGCTFYSIWKKKTGEKHGKTRSFWYMVSWKGYGIH